MQQYPRPPKAMMRTTTSSRWIEIAEVLAGQLDDIQQSDLPPETMLHQCATLCKATLGRLNQQIGVETFKDQEEEIAYFKGIQPFIEGQLFYYKTCARWEWQPGLYQTASLLQKELKKLLKFNRKHHFLYHYWVTGQTYLDDQLFRQHTPPDSWQVNDWLDKQLLARFCGNELLLAHLRRSLDHIRGSGEWTAGEKKGSPLLSWTASKSALIELIYALSSYGAYNHGNISVKEIAAHFESVYSIDLGNFYRSFQEIRIRKKGRSYFLDQLKEKLERRMDDSDEHPRY